MSSFHLSLSCSLTSLRLIMCQWMSASSRTESSTGSRENTHEVRGTFNLWDQREKRLCLLGNWPQTHHHSPNINCLIDVALYQHPSLYCICLLVPIYYQLSWSRVGLIFAGTHLSIFGTKRLLLLDWQLHVKVFTRNQTLSVNTHS